MIWRGTTGKALIVGVTVSALLVLFQVCMMRWNVVIGGQEIAKTGKGLLSYQLVLLHREGLLTAVSVAVAPLLLLWAAVRVLPPWEKAAASSPSLHASARNLLETWLVAQIAGVERSIGSIFQLG